MKTLILKANKVSVYIFDDLTEININEEQIIVGNPVNFLIGDCNLHNIMLYENVTVPQDWKGHKYLFDGSNWLANPNWIDPSLPI